MASRSEARRLEWADPVVRAKRIAGMSAALRGKPRRKTPALKRYWDSMKGKKQSVALVAKRAAAHVGKPLSAAHRATLSRVARKGFRPWLWTPEACKKRSKAISAALKGRKITWHCGARRSSKLEDRVESWLKVNGVVFERQKRIGKMTVDFFLPEYGACLEVDGKYWHSLPGRRAQDARRDYVLQNVYGYDVIRVPEVEVSSL